MAKLKITCTNCNSSIDDDYVFCPKCHSTTVNYGKPVDYKTKLTQLVSIFILILIVSFGVYFISNNDGPKYVGRYEICGFSDAVAFYLDADGTCNNGKGSQNGGIYGHWKKSSEGIVISGMGSEWDGNYMLDGTTDGVALKKGNLRYCTSSNR